MEVLGLLDIHRLPVVILNAIGLWFLLIVFTGAKATKQVYLFLLMAFSMFGWVNFAYLARLVESEDISLLFLKIAWFVTPIFFLSIYLFTLNLLDSEKKYSLLTQGNILLTAVISLVTGFTSFVIENRVINENSLAIEYGILMWPFLIGVAIQIFSVIYVFIKQWGIMGQDQRRNIYIYLVCLVIFYIANIIFNISFPIFLDITRLYFFGDYSTIILAGGITYSIVRFQFLEVKTILTTVLVGIIQILLLIDTFVLSTSALEFGIKMFILGFFFIISIQLVRSVLNEVRQRELLEISEKKYSDLAREQKDIIDVMGHEVKTPLTAIVQELDIQKKIVFPKWDDFFEGKLNQDENQKYLGLIKETLETTDRASTHALSIVTDMLETARLDKKKFSLNYEEFELINLVENAVNLMSKTTSDSNLEIKFDKPTEVDELTVNADKSRINEAILALVNNALKYKDETKDMNKVSISIEIDDKDVIIKVKDNGIGIAPKDISKLGEKFVRLNPKLNGSLKRPGGTGLGLFVVVGIMKHHKGEMIVESEGLHKGSTFGLKFPINMEN